MLKLLRADTDLRGRGRSAWDPHWQNYHPGTYVGDMQALIAHAQLDRFVIVGTSLAGILAMLIAASSPQRVAGVVLNDVGPEVAPDAVARISQYVGRNAPVKNWNEAAEQARATYGAALPDYSDEDWLRYARRGYSENSAGIPVLDMDPKVGDAVRAAAGAGPAPDLWPLWATAIDSHAGDSRGALRCAQPRNTDANDARASRHGDTHRPESRPRAHTR